MRPHKSSGTFLGKSSVLLCGLLTVFGSDQIIAETPANVNSNFTSDFTIKKTLS